MIPLQRQKEFTVSTTVWILFCCMIGLTLRLDYLISSDFVIDGDEAIVGLMGKHMAETGEMPVFYYGQHYMGSLEPLLVSLLFRIFGFVPELLKVVPLGFSLIFIVLLYCIGRDLGGERSGRITALLGAVAPGTLLVWSAKARGGFIEIVVIGAFLVLFTGRWYDNLVKGRGLDFGRLTLIALLAGFGWWVNNQIIYFFPYVALLVFIGIWRSEEFWVRRFRKIFLVGTLCTAIAVLGGLPFWLYNLVHNFASFNQLIKERHLSIGEQIEGLFENALPILVGAKRYWQTEETYSFALEFGYALLLFGLLLGLIGVRRNELRPHVYWGLIFVALSVIGIFVTSPYGYLSQAPRYILPLYVALLPLMGGAISTLYPRSRLLGHSAAAIVVLFHLVSAYYPSRAIPGEPFVYDGERVSKDHSQLIAELEHQGIVHVRTNYWIGYRLAYETGEKVTFEMFQEPNQVRIPRYETVVLREHAQEVPFVLVPKQAPLVTRALKLLGYSFEEKLTSGYVLISNILPRFPSMELLPRPYLKKIISNTETNLPVGNAFDGDVTSRWGSGRPQAAGMEIQIELTDPVEIQAFEYDLGSWKHDFPRKFSLLMQSSGDGAVKEVFSAEDYAALGYLGVRGEPIFLPHPQLTQKLILLQNGSDQVFDWSIAEFRLYQSKRESVSAPK